MSNEFVQVDSVLVDLFPAIHPRDVDSNFKRYIDAHQEELDKVEQRLQDVQRSRYLDHASGKELDKVGAIFGELGKRRGKNDQEYRIYLRSIVQSFRGRGTKGGIKFAVANAIGTDESNIKISEDFSTLTITVRIEDTDVNFISSTVNEMVELADPSGVFVDTPVVVLNGGEIVISPVDGTKNVGGNSGLGDGTLSLDGDQQLGAYPPSVDFEGMARHGRHRFGQTVFGEERPSIRDRRVPGGVKDIIQTGDTFYANTLTVDGELEVRGDLFVKEIQGSGDIYGSGQIGFIQ